MELLWRVLPSLIKGSQMTLLVFFVTLVVSLPLGLLLGHIAYTGPKWLQRLLAFLVWVIRGTPLMLQLMIVFFGLPLAFPDVIVNRLPAALIAFAINYTAYFIEIFRGGFADVPVGQGEVAFVLGFNKWETLLYVTIPQVFKKTLSAIGNEVMTLIKDTSLVYVIGLADIMKVGKAAVMREVSMLPFVGVSLFYLCMTFIFTLLFRYIEGKMTYE